MYKACWISSDNQEQLADFKKHKYQYIAKDKHGNDVFLAESQYLLTMAQSNYPEIKFNFTSELVQ